MAIEVGVNSWVTMDEADTYFSERIGASNYWTSGADKEQALITAYRQIKNAYNLSAETTDNNIKYAQCEQALFLIAFSDEIFRRASLQAQGVVKAGIVKEDYLKEYMGEVPICAMARNFLKDYDTTGAKVRFVDLTRDEEEDYD